MIYNYFASQFMIKLGIEEEKIHFFIGRYFDLKLGHQYIVD